MNNEKISEIDRKIEGLELKRERLKSEKGTRDYLAQSIALEKLSKEHKSVYSLKWLLLIFLVIVDSLPVTFKALTRRGPYDDYLDLSEFIHSHKAKAKKEAFIRTFEDYIIPTEKKEIILSEIFKRIKLHVDFTEKVNSCLLNEKAKLRNQLLEATLRGEENGRYPQNADRLCDLQNEGIMKEIEDLIRTISLEGSRGQK